MFKSLQNKFENFQEKCKNLCKTNLKNFKEKYNSALYLSSGAIAINCPPDVVILVRGSVTTAVFSITHVQQDDFSQLFAFSTAMKVLYHTLPWRELLRK